MDIRRPDEGDDELSVTTRLCLQGGQEAQLLTRSQQNSGWHALYPETDLFNVYGKVGERPW